MIAGTYVCILRYQVIAEVVVTILRAVVEGTVAQSILVIDVSAMP